MEKQKEKNIINIRNQQAQSAIQRAQAENAGLERLMQVWRR
jgi:hypothetical protein